MGSVLGPIFSNYYMLALENKVFNTINKPNIYLRYADDILLLTNSSYEIKTIQETFQDNSVLNFTQEININNKIPFLGVLEPIYNSSVPIQNVALKTCQEQWTIETGDKRGSGRSVLVGQHDDDDCLLDTTCFTYAEDNFIRVTSLHDCINEPMSWKKCVNIHCKEKTL